MVTFTRNSSATQLYLDGVLKITGNAGSIPVGDYFIGDVATGDGPIITY